MQSLPLCHAAARIALPCGSYGLTEPGSGAERILRKAPSQSVCVKSGPSETYSEP